MVVLSSLYAGMENGWHALAHRIIQYLRDALVFLPRLCLIS